MIDRLKDWKPTILGLAIALVIVAALFARPEWGAADLAQLAGAVAAALLGAWARSGQAEKPAAPTVPPGVAGVLLAIALGTVAGLVAAGCARPIDTAIRATNGARSVGETARTAITAACVPAYRAANTSAALAAVDARCVPAERAYVTYAAAHAVAVATVQLAQAGQASEADAVAAAQGVERAGVALVAAVKAVAP